MTRLLGPVLFALVLGLGGLAGTAPAHAAGDAAKGKKVFNKCRAYARRFERFKSMANTPAVRTLLDQYHFSPFETAAFCNLAPESAEEAIAVVPTLKRLPEATLTTIIEEVQPHRKYGD